jgi:hypothetical protein
MSRHTQPATLSGPDPRYVTRRSGVERVREKIGIPLSRGQLNKSIEKGTGPTPVGRYGNADLYDEDEFLDWARSLVKPR